MDCLLCSGRCPVSLQEACQRAALILCGCVQQPIPYGHIHATDSADARYAYIIDAVTGAEIKDCYEADDREGWYRAYRKMPDGKGLEFGADGPILDRVEKPIRIEIRK